MGVRVRGLREVIQELDAMSGRLEDLRPWATAAAHEVESCARHALATETSPDGTRWPAPADPARRRRLLDGIDVFAEATARGLRFGSPDDAAGYHQRGTGHTPRRAFLPIQWIRGRWALMTTGPGGALWSSLTDDLVRYVRGRL